MRRAIGLLAMVWTVGCEVQPLHEACPLDQDVLDKQICNGSAGTVSCVVKRHPQCDQSICISYNSQPAVCSRTCASDADCLSGDDGDFCYEFAEAVTTTSPPTPAQRYCVPKRLKTTATSK